MALSPTGRRWPRGAVCPIGLREFAVDFGTVTTMRMTDAAELVAIDVFNAVRRAGAAGCLLWRRDVA